MIRFAVLLPNQVESRGWLGRTKGSCWATGKPIPTYDNVPQRNATLYVQKAAATKAAWTCGGVVVPVSLDFGGVE